MKKLSSKAFVIIAAISLLLTILFTYFWATLTAPVSTIFSVLVFVTAAISVISINSAAKT